MRLIDADTLKEDLKDSYERLKEIYDGMTYPEDKQICAGQLTTFTEAILRVKEAPTIEAEPVKHGTWIDQIGLKNVHCVEYIRSKRHNTALIVAQEWTNKRGYF